MKKLILLIVFIFQVSFVFASTEYDITFSIKDRSELEQLTRLIGIDNVKDKQVWAVATEKEIDILRKQGYRVTIIPKDKTIVRGMATTVEALRANWDLYPTYDVYEAFMTQLASEHPSLCHYESIGTLSSGRKLMFWKITDNPNIEEDEPEVMLESTMHGDETTGFVLLLRLADYMLSKYGDTDAEGVRITNLINNVTIWIMPLMNPDGTYHGGNDNVSGSRRTNGNNVDLNRNFPDPVQGDHADGEIYQPETTWMMNFCNNHSFSLSVNYHGGSELYNLPWDCKSALHPDDDWFWNFVTPIVQNIQSASPSGYMDDSPTGTPGITNGYAWYVVYGGRQDWMTYFKHGREITVELSGTKNPSSSQLPNYWNWNREAFYMFMEESLRGIRGIVKNTKNQPIAATIDVIGRTEDPAEPVETDPDVGDYHRMLKPGTYSLQCSASGYDSQTVSNIVVSSGAATVQNFTLTGNYPHCKYQSKTIEDICRGNKNGGDGILDAGETAKIDVTLKNDGTIDLTNIQATISTNEPGITISNDTVTFPDIELGNNAQSYLPYFMISILPTVACGTIIHFDLSIQTSQGTFIDAFQQEVGQTQTGLITLFQDNFETDKGWVFAGSGEWERAIPAGGGGQSHGNPDPASAYSGSFVLGNDVTGIAIGTPYDYENNISNSTAQSPAIDCQGFTDVHLKFKRWLNVESPSYDHAAIDVSTNGSNWSQVWQNGTYITDNAWTSQSIDISSYADDQSTVYIRFRINSDTSYQYSGWNIDDFKVTGTGVINCYMTPCNSVPILSLFGILLLLLGFSFVFFVYKNHLYKSKL